MYYFRLIKSIYIVYWENQCMIDYSRGMVDLHLNRRTLFRVKRYIMNAGYACLYGILIINTLIREDTGAVAEFF